MSAHVFVLGVPIDGKKRAELRRLSGGFIPARVSGSIERPCVTCGLACWVGPRSAATSWPVVCPWCAKARGAEVIANMYNPESHLEGDS